MIYRGVKMTEEEQRKKSRRDWLKAVGIVAGVGVVIAAAVMLTIRTDVDVYLFLRYNETL